MGRRGQVTAKDIAKAESLPALVAQLVARSKAGNAEVAEHSVAALKSIATQNHGDNCETLLKQGAMKPLIGLLTHGTADAQANASAAIAAIISKQTEAQAVFVDAAGVAPLVALLKTGSAKVQEEVRAPTKAQSRPRFISTAVVRRRATRSFYSSRGRVACSTAHCITALSAYCLLVAACFKLQLV